MNLTESMTPAASVSKDKRAEPGQSKLSIKDKPHLDAAPPERHGLVPSSWKPEDDRDRVEGVKHRAMKRLAEGQERKGSAEKGKVDREAGAARVQKMTSAVVEERLALVKTRKHARMVKIDLSVAHLATQYLMDLPTYIGLQENGRFFSQIGETMAAKFLRFALHSNKDVRGSDGFRNLGGAIELHSVKSVGKSGIVFQFSSLTGTVGGKFCDKIALRECLDMTAKIVVVDARLGDEVAIVEFCAETAKEWVDLGLLNGSGLTAANFYKYLKASCEIECSKIDAKPIIERLERENKAAVAAWKESKEREAVAEQINGVWRLMDREASVKG